MHAAAVRISIALAAAGMLALGLLAVAAHASPNSPSTAAVSLGDSYISGEAGRWQGNSISPLPGNDSTDRACSGTPVCSVDTTRVYDASGSCHRSDVAEILSSSLAVDQRFNIACSGAQTMNIFRASSGGVGQNGEPPEGDQLLPIAQGNDVRLIMLSIGGNDLGFSSIVTACFLAYTSKTGPCNASQQASLAAKLPVAQANVEKAIDEIRMVMGQAGYGTDDYRLVLQSYPSVVPRASEARYAEVDPQRSTYGCPLYDADLNSARDQFVQAIGGMVRAAARARGAEYLNLADAFQGHELCSVSDSAVTAINPRSATNSEWGRALSPTAFQQGQVQEVFHPDAFGQQALGTCVTKVFALRAGEFDCAGSAGISPLGMVVTRTGEKSAVPGAGGGGTGGGSTGGGSHPQPSGTASVVGAAVRAALKKALVPSGSGGTLRAILKAGSYRTRFVDAYGAGTLQIDWYGVRRATSASFSAAKTKTILVARTRGKLAKSGKYALTVRLARAGRRLLATAPRTLLTGRASFTPRGGAAIALTKRFRLKAR